MFEKEVVKKIAGATVGGSGIVALFLALHGDIKAEIKLAIDRIGLTEDKVIMLETQEIERDKRFLRTMQRFERKLDKIDDKLDKLKEVK